LGTEIEYYDGVMREFLHTMLLGTLDR